MQTAASRMRRPGHTGPAPPGPCGPSSPQQPPQLPLPLPFRRVLRRGLVLRVRAPPPRRCRRTRRGRAVTAKTAVTASGPAAAGAVDATGRRAGRVGQQAPPHHLRVVPLAVSAVAPFGVAAGSRPGRCRRACQGPGTSELSIRPGPGERCCRRRRRAWVLVCGGLGRGGRRQRREQRLGPAAGPQPCPITRCLRVARLLGGGPGSAIRVALTAEATARAGWRGPRRGRGLCGAACRGGGGNIGEQSGGGAVRRRPLGGGRPARRQVVLPGGLDRAGDGVGRREGEEGELVFWSASSGAGASGSSSQQPDRHRLDTPALRRRPA